MQEGIPNKLFLTTDEACRALGIGKRMFARLVADNSRWCRAAYHGTGRRLTKRWSREDIRCLAHIWRNTLHPAQQHDGQENLAGGADGEQ